MVNPYRCYATALETGKVRVVLTKDQPRLEDLILRSYKGEIQSLQPLGDSGTVYIAVPESGTDFRTLATRLNLFIETEYEAI